MEIRSRSGLALIIVAGVLGLLAALAMAFTTLAQLERRASRQRLYATKAKLLARSGIEDALARISAGQDSSLASTRFLGENWDNDNPGTLNGLETAAEVHGPGTLDVGTCPVRHALRPSFFVKDPGSLGADLKPAPELGWINGRERGYSGRLYGTAVGPTGTYALKVEDESGKINVNGGFLDAGDRDGDGIPDRRDPVVGRDAVTDYDEDWNEIVISPAIPYVGWNGQVMRILDVLGNQPGVGVPGLGTTLIGNRPEGGYVSMDHVQAALGTTSDLSPYLTTRSWTDTRVIRPVTTAPYYLDEGGRPPVNLNAATRPVLQALVEGLAGNCTGGSSSAVLFSIISPTMASGIAQSIMDGRPFKSWADFGTFCDGLVPSVITGFAGSGKMGGNLCVADLLKANFDPNTRLNKAHPDHLLWRWIDKSDLTTWSTEGSLGPTGMFRISVCARLTRPDGRLLAEARRDVLVEAFSLLRQTTQKDFVGDRTSVADYLSLSTDADPVALMNGSSAGSSWWGGTPPGMGVAAITYPSPPTALPGNAASFDGCVGLATIDLAPSWFCPDVRFLHHFDDSWEADPPTPFPSPLSLPGAQLQPDGCPAASGAAFDAENNLPLSTVSGDPAPSDHAVFSYWTKAQPTGPMTKYNVHMEFRRLEAESYTQCISVGAENDFVGIQAESRAEYNHNTDGNGEERKRAAGFVSTQASVLLSGPRWVLVTGHFDTDEGTVRDLGTLASGARGSATLMPWDGHQTFTSSLRERLAGPGSWIRMSSSQQWSIAVVDELAICDFGDNAAAAMAAYALKHSDRYKLGRYYRLNDAAFLSEVLTPAGGAPVRLLKASWTAYLPKEIRQELPCPSGAMYSDPPVPVQGQPRAIDPILQESRLEVELLDAPATLGTPNVPPLCQGGPLAAVIGRFRYRVTFKPDPRNPSTGAPDPANQPVLESPWFDDITFAWQPMTGPRILAWE